MSASMTPSAGAAATTEFALLDQIVEQSKVAKSSTEHARAKDIISELVSQVMDGTVVVSDNLAATIDARVAELDSLISKQLSAILHAPEFQKLESSWTGLNYLVKNSATGQNLKIKMLNATKKELVKDFQSALEFDQSTMFKKVYEEEFGTFGGAPFGALLGDFEITRQPEDMYFIEQMSHVAAASHAPFISAASPELFGLETYSDLGKPRDLSKVFDTVEYAKWKTFRESEDARYVGLTLPRFLGRLPFNPAEMKGAWAAAATCDICSRKYMSSGWRVNSKSPSSAPNGAPPKVPNSSSYTFLNMVDWSNSSALWKSRTSSRLVALSSLIFRLVPVGVLSTR